jgi:hypothetical protein
VDFSSKNLTAQEKECTKACFVKQMSVFASLVQNTTAHNQ